MNKKIPADAFDYYASLGPERTYSQVADKYGISRRAVSKCATREHWQTRLSKIERESREQADKRIGETLADMRERHMKTLRAMSARALEGMKNFPITSGMDAIRCAEVAIKLERLIVGEPTERNAVSIEETIKRQYDTWFVDDDDGEDGGDEGGDEESNGEAV